MNLRSIARKPFFDLWFLEPTMSNYLRFAINDCLLYDPKTQKGGPHSTIVNPRYKKAPTNEGLSSVGKKLKEFKSTVKGNHITNQLSLADLIQVGGVSAVEYCGGPAIQVGVGRTDINDENQMVDAARLPGYDLSKSTIKKDAQQIRDYYYPLGFQNHEIVALFGNRTLGFLKNKDWDQEQRWSRNPYVFDNNYFQELLDNTSPYIRTQSDLALINDNDFYKWVEAYARDRDLFFEHFSDSYKRLSEIGYSNLQYEL